MPEPGQPHGLFTSRPEPDQMNVYAWSEYWRRTGRAKPGNGDDAIIRKGTEDVASSAVIRVEFAKGIGSQVEVISAGPPC